MREMMPGYSEPMPYLRQDVYDQNRIETPSYDGLSTVKTLTMVIACILMVVVLVNLVVADVYMMDLLYTLSK